MPFLLNEIFREQVYLQNGVSLQPGDTVIDVGANIGLFTVQAADIVGQQVVRASHRYLTALQHCSDVQFIYEVCSFFMQGRVICIEPAPAAFEALLCNALQYQKLLGQSGARN